MSATARIDAGSSRVVFNDPRPDPRYPTGREIPLWLYKPERHGPDDRIVVVMHGMSRNADAYRDAWAEPAERHNLMVVAPEFSDAAYPETYDYNYGNMVTPDGVLLDRKQWLFPLVEKIFAFVRDRSGSRRETFGLYGHSAGGQLVHRLVTFAWTPAIERAITANAGSYTMPDFDVSYPFGLKGTHFADADLPVLLSRPLTVLLGEQDCDPTHHNLPRQPEAMAQGPHRFARGQAYFAAGRAAAGVGAFNWRIDTVPGVAHSNPGMAAKAAAILAGG